MTRRDTIRNHASEPEAEEFAALQRRASEGRLTTEELLRLALQLFEQVHEPFEAVDVLKQLLQQDPTFDLARIWLGYLDVYELMDDDALLEAIAVAEEVSSTDDRLRAAALLVKGAALRHLARMGPAISAVEESVRLAGDWVTNRLALGDLYRDAGRRVEAVDQFGAALENFESSRRTGRRLEQHRDRELFEMYLTGLAASETIAEFIRHRLRAVGG